MSNNISIIAVAALLGSLCFSCKKSGVQQQCTLATLTDSTASAQSATQFTYDNTGRILSMVITGQGACRKILQYNGYTIVFSVTDTTPGVLNEVDTITLNSAGLIQTQASHLTSSGAFSRETFFYDATGVATSSVEAENGEPGDTIAYTTVNGNLMYDKEPGATTNKDEFTYYANQSIIYGDPTDFRQLFYYGAYYYKNKNMLSVLYSPSKSYKAYTYTVSGNRIAQAVMRLWTPAATDTITHTLTYAYSCQ